MADNFPLTPGSGRLAATDQVTYSGDTADVQLVRLVLVSGAEGSKTVTGLPGDGTAGLNVQVAAALPAGANAIGAVTNLAQLGGAAVAMGTGARSAGTQRVTIATDDVVPAAQSGTWTVQPGNTANTTAWKVDASGVAVPVTDNSGSLTVDAPAGTPVFVRLSDGAAALATLPVKLIPDVSRTYVTLYAQAIAGVTTEALATFTKNVNGTVTTAQTAYTITSGKVFRIQALQVVIANTTTVANNIICNVRVAATVSATSPVVLTCAAAALAAIATVKGADNVTIDGGIDLLGDGSIQVGVSHLENVTTAAIASFTLIGYEYTP